MSRTPFPWREFGAVAALQLAFGVATFGRFPPVADGTFYHGFAVRLAAGLGYTFAWPDGAVTYAAHYPVGYPALLSLLYLAFGPHAGLAWVLGAALHLGAAAALARATAGTRARRFVMLAYGLHPALFFYTPTLMTEAVTANLLVLGTFALWRMRCTARGALLAGLIFGVATLVRPQSILVSLGLAGFLLLRGRAVRAAAVLAVVPFLVCAPWTLRNCDRMQRCALVSVNGGWNLLIGAHTEQGAWQALETPPACREVWDEAAKDECFGREARREILAAPGRWLLRVPAKARATFDYFGAAPYTLHESNPALLGERGKTVLAVAETGWQRALLVLAALSFWKHGRRRRAGSVVAMAAALWPHGASWSILMLAALALASARDRSDAPWRAGAGLVLLATLALHAIFFGGGRYGLVVVPWVVWLAGTWLAEQGSGADVEILHGSSSRPENGIGPVRSRAATASSGPLGSGRSASAAPSRSVNASAKP